MMTDDELDELIIRALRGQATEAEQSRLTAWRRDPRNDTRFQEMEQVWSATAPAYAAEPPPLETFIAHRQRRRVTPWIGIAATVAAFAGGSLIWAIREAQFTQYVASEAASRVVQLEDGSLVQLEPGAVLRFRASPSERLARLDGDGYFGVAENAERPFVVQSGQATVTVLGTRFAVTDLDSGVTVVVIEGRVRVEARGHNVTAAAGDVVTSGQERLRSETVANPFEYLDTSGIVIFKDTPLSDVARELSMRFNRTVTVHDSIATRRITAWFPETPLEGIVEAVAAVSDARVVVSADSLWIEP